AVRAGLLLLGGGQLLQSGRLGLLRLPVGLRLLHERRVGAFGLQAEPLGLCLQGVLLSLVGVGPELPVPARLADADHRDDHGRLLAAGAPREDRIGLRSVITGGRGVAHDSSSRRLCRQLRAGYAQLVFTDGPNRATVETSPQAAAAYRWTPRPWGCASEGPPLMTGAFLLCQSFSSARALSPASSTLR